MDSAAPINMNRIATLLCVVCFFLCSCQYQSCHPLGSKEQSGDMTRSPTAPLPPVRPRCADLLSIDRPNVRIICEERQVDNEVVAGVALTSMAQNNPSLIAQFKQLAGARAWWLLGLILHRSNSHNAALRAMCEGIQELGNLHSTAKHVTEKSPFGYADSRDVDSMSECMKCDFLRPSTMFEFRLHLAMYGISDHKHELEYEVFYPDDRELTHRRRILWLYNFPGGIAREGLPVGDEWPVSSNDFSAYVEYQLSPDEDLRIRDFLQKSHNIDELLSLFRSTGASIEKNRITRGN